MKLSAVVITVIDVQLRSNTTGNRGCSGSDVLGRSVSMLPQKSFQIFGLRNAISCVFRRKFSVSKCEGNIIYISSVIGRVQYLREKGESSDAVPGGDSHMKQTGMLVRNFEFNP